MATVVEQLKVVASPVEGVGEGGSVRVPRMVSVYGGEVIVQRNGKLRTVKRSNGGR